jgi:hypothetical protein
MKTQNILVFSIAFMLFTAASVFAVWPFDARGGNEEASDSLNLDRQAYVGVQQFAPLRDSSWVDNCLNLGADIPKFGVKIIAYRLKWFSGHWSDWYVPGVNDLYKKPGEPLRRQWACFSDHTFEIMYTAPKKTDWKNAEEPKGKDSNYDDANW